MDYSVNDLMVATDHQSLLAFDVGSCEYAKQMRLREQVVGVTIWLVMFTAIAGQVPSWYSSQSFFSLSSHNTTIALQSDGSAVVIEHIVPASQIARLDWSTPITYPGSFADEPRVVKIVDVTDADDHALRFTQKRSLHWLDLRIDTAGAPEIRVVYEVRNATRFLVDRDEIVWTAGEGWRGPVGQSSIAVQAPEEAASQLTAQVSASHGPKLAAAAPGQVEGSHVSMECPGPLAPNQYCVAEIVLPKGILQQPSVLARAGWWLRANPILLLPVFAFVVMAGWRAWKRQATANFSIAPAYELPKEVTPAEAGVLIDDSVDPRDVIATIFDLAVRGYVHMERCQPDDDVAFQGQDYILRLVKSSSEWQGLASHERATLFHIFYGGQWTKLSSLHLRFYSVMPIIRGELLDSLRRKGLYRFDPERAILYRQAMTLGVVGLLIAGQVAGLFSVIETPLFSLFAVLASAVIVWWYGRDVTAKTVRGMRVCAQIRGLLEFMARVDGDRLKRIPAEDLEKSLPYAIALGVEQHWASGFVGITTAPPKWFSEVDPTFDATQFLHALDGFAREAKRALTSSPRGHATPPPPFPKDVRPAVKTASAGSGRP